jgi:HAMP domain-containing protein/signal transduction histidine kinase/CheY-like chemotaxis protein
MNPRTTVASEADYKRELLQVLESFRRGDFSVRMPVNGRGTDARIARSLNDIIGLNERMAREFGRISNAVGKEGRINQRADMGRNGGGWAACVESINTLIGDVVQPSTEVARVVDAVAKGDLSQNMTLEVDGRPLKGEFLRTARVVNTMVGRLNGFANEVTRVAREVGAEGKLGGQAVVQGVAGVWKDLTDNVNSMAGNLTNQVRNIAEVTTAVARGDLSTKITVDARGEILELKNTINTMVDQLSSFASEVTRVAREVGTEGELGGQAEVRGVAGTWKDLTESVNSMASNLTNQVRNIAAVTTAVAKGDLSQKITVDARGEFLELKNTINTMVGQLSSFASEVTRVAREVGTEGKLGGQAVVKEVAGVWKDLTDNVNSMAGNLTNQVRNIAEVTTAVAEGDLSTKVTVDARGEILELRNTINTMVDQLNAFAGEVTRVAREVGTEGKLGGQAEVKDVGGVWKDLTDNVNSMAGNLTNQVRNIAGVTTAVARGDLSTKITVDAQGEILELKNTINIMVDQLSSFASEVTRVAREVGTEGELGGQAEVKGVAGTWKDLTVSVNSMASNLTNQVRNIAAVTTAVAKGDLSQKITVDARGEFLELKNTINTMVGQLSSFASEVTRVAREVGTEGKLGGQAEVKDVGGVWKDLTDNVNSMAGNLTNQVRNIAGVTTAVARGDLSTKITVNARGEIMELKNTINTMVDQLNAFASEVTRVAREVGTEGKLGGQAVVKDVGGIWKDLTDNVNSMAGNLTNQVRNIAGVTTAVARGDLSTKITVDARGEILELKNTINTMVDQLNAFGSEVTRVAREVGTEGKLGGQAVVKDVAGVWKDLTESVNSMASNLTNQVRNIAEVTTAVANGDLSRKITVDVRGEILELKNTINTMVDQLNGFASEVTRVAREVGTEGKLGGQAQVRGVAGTWKDLTESVNSMASNLTNQVRNIAEVTTAVANGNLSRKITVDVRGEILELKNTFNTMVDQLNGFASEVTRVAREVGTEGKLGGQAEVKGVAGTWKDLTESVNSMASNLTNQVRNIAEVTTAVANGDLSRKITVDVRGEILELKNTINTMVDQLNGFGSEVTRVAREVGTEGKLGGQAVVRGVAGVWKDLTESVNSMASNLTNQVRNIAAVTTAVANGDLSRKITVDVRGEILELKNTINTMVDQLNSFASEVTRVAREVGTEGILGGQAQVKGVGGTWKDLTDNVNFMAANLTTQVRGIAKVVTAVANGDLKRKLVLETKGEIAQLADTINGMIDTLAVFADQVTSVAREVGIEGKLGGQARVPGAAGIWRDLTNNVNQLAANLTTQVRAIAEVATAVTKGDLTRSIALDAQGEMAALKDTINEMISNLKETTSKNTEQDWLKTNVARFTSMVQGQRDLLTVCKLVLSELAPLVNAQQGIFYINDATENEAPMMKLFASYAYRERKNVANTFQAGEGLVGQCALERERFVLTNVPPDYIKISSGLGEASPLSIVVLPVLFEGRVKAVIELASFHQFSEIHLAFLDQLTESMGIVLNTIAATMRTEELLKQSQALAEELQSQQSELTNTNKRLEQQANTLQASEELLKNQQEQLQRTNAELQEKARLLVEQKTEVERKNREVEQAKAALEEKAEQLALTSKYKSEFLANMSHELRTPLNNLLILAKMLAENSEGNLNTKQVKFAETIHSSGTDLLSLINDILDLTKIESGTMAVEPNEVRLDEVRDYVHRNFRHVADGKGLDFTVELSPDLPRGITTDVKRLQQVLKNLLSNALKFTERGRVALRIEHAATGWHADNLILANAESVIAFSVEDTGIGIPADKQRIIFEAFQQADGTTSRKYGGTGLGLSISREIAHLLGGEIRLYSVPGVGSTFTLYLPQSYVAPAYKPEPRAATPRHSVTADLAVPTRLKPSLLARADQEDDRDNIAPSDAVVLAIEDDATYSRFVLDAAHAGGYKVLLANRGDMGLAMARKFRPESILLDIGLPDTTGWAVLDQLQHDSDLRHIPVHMLSVMEDRRRGRALGATSYFHKTEGREVLDDVFRCVREYHAGRVRRALVLNIAEPDRAEVDDVLQLDGVTVTYPASVVDALECYQAERHDCLILGADSGEISLADQIVEFERTAGCDLDVIVYAPEGSVSETLARTPLRSGTVIRRITGADLLLREVTRLLHIPEPSLPEYKRLRLDKLRQVDRALTGSRVLIVDDDVRNIFALTSILERHQMEVLHAENGRAGIDRLLAMPGIDMVLMDIMMPGMDGYQTIQAIREVETFRDLPIIAVTAKAMKGDREKCLESGASDYIAKPVDLDQLFSLMRVWLHSRRNRSAGALIAV